MIKIIISVLRFVSLNTESQMRIKNIVIHANNHRNKQKKTHKKNPHTHTYREQPNSDLRPTAKLF